MRLKNIVIGATFGAVAAWGLDSFSEPASYCSKDGDGRLQTTADSGKTFKPAPHLVLITNASGKEVCGTRGGGEPIFTHFKP